MKKLICLLIFFSANSILAQEGVRALSCNLNYIYGDLKPAAVEQLGKPVTQKKAVSLFLPFKDDFFYGVTSKYPRTDLWGDSLVYVNSGFARAPPSIGVATFDGLNRHGYPYVPLPANENASLHADTLTTRSINLLTTVNGQTIYPSNNVALTFYYQARGYGETPELNDSLMLDLYKPLAGEWVNRVWAMKGNTNPNTNDTTFRRVYIGIRDTAYFHDGFKFRFRNKATTCGNFDHWHIDYVYLNQNRDSIADTTYNDVTFSQVPTPFLKNYSAMPYRQYSSSDMSKNNTVLMQNIFTQTINIYYQNDFYNETNTKVYSYSPFADNISPFRTSGYFKNPAFSNPASQSTFTYSFPDPLPKPQGFKTKHFVYRSGTGTDFIPDNDTVVQHHLFYDYFAFDDGSPEAGYYVNGANGKMVLKIDLKTTDTLRGLRVYFDPAPIGSTEKYYFKILVRSGSLPGIELNTSDKLYYPRFDDSAFKPLQQYDLPEPMVLDPGTYFIGIQQQVSTGLVVGLDRNYDSHTNLYYDPGGGFVQSGIRGSLMMRPVFGSPVGVPTGIKQEQADETGLMVYPNPAHDYIIVRTTDFLSGQKIRLFNSVGQVVNQTAIQQQETIIQTEGLSAGIYFLSVSGGGKSTQTRKIMITD